MGTYRKRQIVVQAVRWMEQGDHPAVKPQLTKDNDEEEIYRDTGFGVIETLEGPMKVTPGDWIITGVKGEHYPCKNDIFEMTYEEV